MKLLKELYKIYSPTGREKGMRKFITKWIKENCHNTMVAKDEMGNLYVTKGKAETFPCLVAHMDQVQKSHPIDFEALETEDIIFGFSHAKKQYFGLGADDKNGIWVCLKCLEKYDAIKVAFFVQEEIGCVGSQKAEMSFFDNCRYVLQIDRKGSSDLITNIGGWTPLCSMEFVDAVKPEIFGYKEEVGMMTDVEVLKENGLRVSAVNISCGYYNPHTDNEFTLKSELINCLNFVQHIIETCKHVYPHVNERGDYEDYNKMMEEDEIRELIAYQIQRYPELKAKDFMDWYAGCYFYLKEEDFTRLIEEEKRRSFMK